jgi:hypothetical protein
MNYAHNIKFFKPKPSLKGPIIFIVIGMPLLLLHGLGLLFIAIGIAWLYLQRTGIPTEAEIDAQAAELGKDIENYALKKMSLEREQLIADSIIFWGYDLGKPVLKDPVIADECLQDKRDSRGDWRSPHVVINAILFTENEIHSLRRYASLVSNASTDKKDEFAYRHVAGISSDTEQYERNGQTFEWNVVVLRSGGERFPFCSVDNTTAENAEKALKALWRQKNS